MAEKIDHTKPSVLVIRDGVYSVRPGSLLDYVNPTRSVVGTTPNMIRCGVFFALGLAFASGK